MNVTYVEPRTAYDLAEAIADIIRKDANMKPGQTQRDILSLVGQLTWAIDDLTNEITRLQQELADQR